MAPLGRGQAGAAEGRRLKEGPIEQANIHLKDVTKVCNVTSGVVGGSGKQKESKGACVGASCVLAGSSAQAERSASGSPPAAASRRGKYRS